MRTLAMISAALLGLAFVTPSYAQSAAAPQPGLPPGAGVGAPMAQAPAATGAVATTTTQPVARMPRKRRVVRHRRAHVTRTAPAATTAPAAPK